jgi:hypothetical protein
LAGTQVPLTSVFVLVFPKVDEKQIDLTQDGLDLFAHALEANDIARMHAGVNHAGVNKVSRVV